MTAPSLLEAAPTACCADEKWAAIPAWPHEASTCGRLRSITRRGDDGVWRLGQDLPLHLDKRPGKGYVYGVLRDGKRRRKVHVAAAVLEAHDELRPSPEHEASHANDIRTDNHRSNLSWETKAANLAKMWERRRRAAANLVTTPPDLSQPPGQRGGGGPCGLSRPVCHRASSPGTVSSRLPSPFPFLFLPVKSSLRSLRSLRSHRKSS